MLQENNSELLHDVLFYFTSKYSCSIYFQKLKQNLNLQWRASTGRVLRNKAENWDREKWVTDCLGQLSQTIKSFVTSKIDRTYLYLVSLVDLIFILCQIIDHF